MASMVTEAVPASPGVTQLGTRPAGLGGALRSEFTKLRSVRSTYWTLITLVVFVVGIGLLVGLGLAHAASHGHYHGSGTAGLFGLIVGQLIIAVLGALTVTSEFSTGMMRTSLTVMPRRGTLIAAKGIVFLVTALVTGLIASFGAFFACQAFLAHQHLALTLGEPNVLRAVIGGALFLTAAGMLAFGLGLLIRHTAGAICAAVGLLFVLFVLFQIASNFLPASWANDITRWIPLNAGIPIWQVQAQPASAHLFGPWTGFAVFCGYAAVALAAGMISFRKRNV
jgi:ABC-2 type transport system permease protein